MALWGDRSPGPAAFRGKLDVNPIGCDKDLDQAIGQNWADTPGVCREDKIWKG